MHPDKEPEPVYQDVKQKYKTKSMKTVREFLMEKGLLKSEHFRFVVSGSLSTINLGNILEEYSRQVAPVWQFSEPPKNGTLIIRWRIKWNEPTFVRWVEKGSGFEFSRWVTFSGTIHKEEEFSPGWIFAEGAKYKPVNPKS